ncbi:MAG: VWA domain-containing protein [Candidatus Melainabacteria bacterium]|nr:MAG: VWA domain-containing protein [Candidatus Melainabacteria bacterium]
MKRLALASALSLAATILLSPMSQASGFIVIDSAVSGGALLMPPMTPVPAPIPPVRPVHPVNPHPGRPVTPPIPTPGPRPILKGGVSFGLHMQSEQIKVDITDQVAKTYITQTFSNDTDRNLAGTYLFPLPEDTTFSSFSLHIDGKPVEGKILEAQEARTQYEQIVRSMVDPGLLEYADYKTVRARIFPIPAHGTKKVELEYTQILHAENGMLKYRFPLKAEGESEPIDEVKIDAKLNSKQGLRTIWSPTHTISSNRSDNNQAKVTMLAHNSIPDKDFLLYYSVSNKDLAANLLTHKNEGEDGYFLLTLTPPVQSKEVIGKDIVLVADTSGSMQGDKIVQTKKALKYIVDALSPVDKFSIVQFATDVESFKPQVVPATPENKKAAAAFIDDLEARGGTNISDAMHTGLTMLNQVSDRPAYCVLMTDGEPTVGETNVSTLLKSIAPKRDTRIFDFGVGYDVNTKLLNKLAEEHHGSAQYVEPSENLETALSGFYQKIKSPVLSNVSIAYDGITVKDVYPREVKDIFAGSQVLLLGKYKNGAKATVNLTGKVNGVAKAYSFPLNFESNSADHTYLPRLWAMRRIGHLTEVAQDNGDSKEVVDEIVALSKKYGIISNYTSFLVTDPSEGHGTAINRPMPMRREDVNVMRRMRNGLDFIGAVPGGGGAKGFASPRQSASESHIRGTLVAGRLMSETGMIPPPPAASPVWMPESSLAKSVHFAGSRTHAELYDYMPYERDFRSTHSMVVEKKAGAYGDSGKVAVVNSKAVNKLKNTDVVAMAKDEESAAIKSIEDKTFYLRNGVWVDSTYSEGSAPKAVTIQFGSKEYFDLIHNTPGISKYLSVGREVALIFKGHAYRVISPPAA